MNINLRYENSELYWIKDNERILLVNYWWEDNNFWFITEHGETFQCKKTYPINIHWEGLDYSNSEECNVELTMKYSSEVYKEYFTDPKPSKMMEEAKELIEKDIDVQE